MIRGHWPAIIVGTALITITILLAGCGGEGEPWGDGGQPPPPPPPVGTATVQGTVVDATDPTLVLPGAQVVVADDNPAALTDTNGSFTLTQVPAGGVTLKLTFPSTGAYQATNIAVNTVGGQTTHVTLAALPTDTVPPTSVALKPGEVTIDVGGEVQFGADVRVYGAPVSITPSFSLIGEVGTLTPGGLFTATGIGTATVGAHFAAASDTGTVQVVAPRAPRLGTLNVSPSNLPAEGGEVRISVTATDGDGISSVEAEVEQPNRAIATQQLQRESGSSRDGSWAGSYFAPPNSSPPDLDGKQLDQRYSVRVRARDFSGASVVSQWMDFAVAGLEPPPGPP